MALLAVRNLTLHYHTTKGDVSAVEDVSFSLEQGEALGLVGESGCGKTSLALTLLRLLPDNGQIEQGQVLFQGTDLVGLPEAQMRQVRWSGISMVFQAAMNALNPVYKVGDQIIEAIQAHEPLSRQEARRRVEELFELVGLNPNRIDSYPHEYSGGMKQRAIIAMALSCHPELIIADEPTTALDVIVQDRILRRMDELRRRLHMSMIYISHDIAVIAEVAENIGVMYAGKLVELGPTTEIFARPRHPYTVALMSSFPSIKGPKTKLVTVPGEPPNLLEPPTGCRFHPRCPYASKQCELKEPLMEAQAQEHWAACWYPVRSRAKVEAQAR